MRKPTASGEISPYVVRSVGRALDVLIALGEAGRAATNLELSMLVGLHPTTTLRMLETLRSRGLVRQLGDASYEVGPRALDIGNAFLRRLSISRFAHEIVEELSATVNETASVGVLDEGRVLYVAIAQGQQDLGIQSVPFARHPVHCTALGKAMLAALPWDEASRILALQPRERLTQNTLVDLIALRQELEKSASRGYAVDREERTAGVTCIAAPIRDHLGHAAAAVSVAGSTFRLRQQGIEKLARLVIAAAAAASERLGATSAAAPAAPRRSRR
jgi:IclR family acetate operon transcriptional repressor